MHGISKLRRYLFALSHTIGTFLGDGRPFVRLERKLHTTGNHGFKHQDCLSVVSLKPWSLSGSSSTYFNWLPKLGERGPERVARKLFDINSDVLFARSVTRSSAVPKRMPGNSCIESAVTDEGGD